MLLPIKEIKLARGYSYELHTTNPITHQEIRRRFPSYDLALAAYVAVQFNGVFPAEVGDLLAHNVTVAQLIAEYLADFGGTYRSKQHFQQIAAKHFLPAFGKLRVDMVTEQDVRRFFDAAKYGRPPYTGQTYKTSTLKHWYGLLAAIFNYAVRARYCDVSPVRGISFSSRPAGVPVWTPQQAKKFLSHLKKIGHFHYPYWYVALSTGLRGGELAALRWCDVVAHSDGSGTIKVEHGRSLDDNGKRTLNSPKTDSSIRSVYVGPSVMKVLREHWELVETVKARYPEHWHDLNLVFPRLDMSRRADLGTMMAGRELTITFHKYRARLGLPYITPHAFRHLHSDILLYELELPDTVAQARLGHATIAMTKDVYSQAPEHLLRKAASDFDEFLVES